MYKLSEETMNNIDKKIRETLGISYEEYEKLDFDEQQKLLSKYRKKHYKKENKRDMFNVMIGYGDNSFFTQVKKGEDVMVRYGNIIEAGLTREEEKQRIEDDLDDILYSKPISFVKKLKRRIKSRF